MLVIVAGPNVGSLLIATVAVALLMVAPLDGLDRVTLNASAPSVTLSLKIGTVIILDVSLAANVKVPEVEV